MLLRTTKICALKLCSIDLNLGECEFDFVSFYFTIATGLCSLMQNSCDCKRFSSIPFISTEVSRQLITTPVRPHTQHHIHVFWFLLIALHVLYAKLLNKINIIFAFLYQ